MYLRVQGHMAFPLATISAPLTSPAISKADLRTAIRRDLRDSAEKGFTNAEIDDLIDFAFVEVSNAYPKEVIDEFECQAGKTGYTTICTEVFRVEVERGGNLIHIQPGDGDPSSQSGWELFGGALWLTDRTADALTADDNLRIWGYAPRIRPNGDDDVVDCDEIAERGVRAFAVLNGWQRLAASRALFSQWNSQPGNTDVSLNQLTGWAATAEAQWQSLRRQMRLMRRV